MFIALGLMRTTSAGLHEFHVEPTRGQRPRIPFEESWGSIAGVGVRNSTLTTGEFPRPRLPDMPKCSRGVADENMCAHEVLTTSLNISLKHSNSNTFFQTSKFLKFERKPSISTTFFRNRKKHNELLSRIIYIHCVGDQPDDLDLLRRLATLS